jgi:hypothetical protein
MSFFSGEAPEKNDKKMSPRTRAARPGRIEA